MASTRRALILTNPGEAGAQDYCKGVHVDAKNYRRLFREPYGGYWEDNEIVHLDRPTCAQVRTAVDALQLYDYSFVAFCGHGWYSSTQRATICTFRKGEEMKYSDLLKNCTKRTLILDCCRKVYAESIRASLMEKRASATFATRRQPKALECRALFSKRVELSSPGPIVIYSCAQGETAGDNENFGGRYSSALIGTADRWADAQAEGLASPLTAVASIVECHDPAALETKDRSGGAQNPSIDKPRSAPYFPFAVFA